MIGKYVGKFSNLFLFLLMGVIGTTVLKVLYFPTKFSFIVNILFIIGAFVLLFLSKNLFKYSMYFVGIELFVFAILMIFRIETLNSYLNTGFIFLFVTFIFMLISMNIVYYSTSSLRDMLGFLKNKDESKKDESEIDYSEKKDDFFSSFLPDIREMKIFVEEVDL